VVCQPLLICVVVGQLISALGQHESRRVREPLVASENVLRSVFRSAPTASCPLF
jgi:hypothetical protein